MNEDIQKTATLSHVELALALSSFASTLLTATFTSKEAEIYLLSITPWYTIHFKDKREII